MSPKPRKKGLGTGTVAKALANLTTAGELVNPKDKKGYRLATWPPAPRYAELVRRGLTQERTNR